MKKIVRQRQKQQIVSFRYRKGLKLSRHEAEEFGPGKTDIILCPEGDAVYYFKSWHHSLRRYRYLSEDKDIRFELCLFHQMKKNRQWEGEVRITGIPPRFKTDIKKTAEGRSQEAYRRDPMHRILDIKEGKEGLRIFTSENQLARRIAKKIASSLKKHISRPKIHKGKGSDPVLITMEWKE